ncbi:NUDIX domain-containing protein [Kineosporia sp. A_224]|uniref:NUDIX domain-containing protein n=1 Tax=Kineosporia sp. A_224 TaxID=1962180 RepID=UPI000B4B7736|nr:NUDIX domain-containing protein [Kineosporia sp. A_224]
MGDARNSGPDTFDEPEADAAQAQWFLDLPRKRVAAGLVVTDDAGRVLLVKPTYKPSWEVPGGLVENGEAPRAAAARECREELGLDVAVGRLLVCDWMPPARLPDDAVLFLYASGPLDTDAIVLATDELSTWEWVDPADLDDRLPVAMTRRVRVALEALGSGEVVELEHGHRVAAG